MTKSIEEIVEEFKEMSQTFVKAGWDETNNLAYKQFETNWTEEQLDWLTQTLTAERQKREEAYAEGYNDKDKEISEALMKDGVTYEELKLTNNNK